MDETPINKVLEYGRIIYESGRYEEAKLILNEFYKICHRRNVSKAIMALWILFSINVLTENWRDLTTTFNQLREAIEFLKSSLEDEFKKTNFDAVRGLYKYRPKKLLWILNKCFFTEVT
jgi:hypothetical protein